MENKEIVNFSEFFGDNSVSKLSTFDRENFKDFFLPEEEEVIVESKKEEPKTEPAFDPPVDAEEFVIDEEEPKELDVEDSLGSYDNDKNFTKVKEEVENYYSVYKDKSENFICDVLVEGCKLNETKARLILESDEWNLMFEGDIDRYGKCNIPIKKLNILEEGMVGKIRLEVIAENTVFIPWEEDFKVKMSKKVSIQFGDKPKKEVPNMIKESKVKVRVNR